MKLRLTTLLLALWIGADIASQSVAQSPPAKITFITVPAKNQKDSNWEGSYNPKTKEAVLPLLLAQAKPEPIKPEPAAKQDAKVPDKKHQRGRKAAPPEVRAAWHASAVRRNGNAVGKFPKVTAPKWDCRDLGMVLPVDDQGPCGDCFGVSAADGCSMALIKANKLPNDTSKGRLSSQYGLDCGKFQGGCGGGDEAQVIDEIMHNGFPLTSDYGPYTANPGRCKASGLTMHKIVNYGFCTPAQQQGIADTQDMKNCIAQYGPISVAFDASGCDSYQWPNVMKGRGNNVDHAVLCIGWDDSLQAFLGMNQWGGWGGPGGTFWIGYGSYSWGTEAIWIDGGAPIPPPPPPPGPVGPGPVITSALTAAGQVGAAFSYQVTASGSPTAFGASGLPAGLSVDTAKGIISGAPTSTGVNSVTLIAINSGGAGTATLTLTVTSGPPVPANPSITISTDLKAGQYEIVPTGSVVITADMTLKEIMDKVNKVRSGQGQVKTSEPPVSEDIVAMKRWMTAAGKVLIQLKKDVDSLKKEPASKP